MDLKLTGKRALVSGGSRGIGKATANLLVREGAHVVILARDENTLAAAANDIARATGGTIFGVRGDTTDSPSVTKAVAKATDLLGGPIEILVNAAAEPLGNHAPSDLPNITADALLGEVDTKVMGYIRMTQAVVGGMRQTGWGRIVNVGGLAAKTTGHTIGTIRNVAVAAMTKNLADELGPLGISVNGVHPGTTLTERSPALFAKQAREKGTSVESIENQLAAANTLGTIVTAEDVAQVIAFLCSPLAKAINGEMVPTGAGSRGSIYY